MKRGKFLRNSLFYKYLCSLVAFEVGREYVVKFINVNLYKRYIIIDQQIACRHFVDYSEWLYQPLPYYATQIINPFLTLRISANHDKWL